MLSLLLYQGGDHEVLHDGRHHGHLASDQLLHGRPPWHVPPSEYHCLCLWWYILTVFDLSLFPIALFSSFVTSISIKIPWGKNYDPDAILGPLPAHGPLLQDPCVDCSPSSWDCLWAPLYWTCQEIICYLFEKYKLLGGSSISDMPRDNVLSFHNILWAPGFLILNLRHINTFIHL